MKNSSQNEPRGLTTFEAQELLQKFGPNEISDSHFKNQLRQMITILSDPMGLMMLGLSVLYYFTGDVRDALIILAAYVPVTAVDVFLELRSEKTLRALNKNLQSRAQIWRDGRIQQIPISEIVPGDYLVFEEGQHLPADGRVLESRNLNIDESSVTGESIPVEKFVGDSFSAGTLTLTGAGLGQVTKTGKDSQVGQLSQLLASTQSEISPLQKNVHAVVKKVLWIAFLLVLILFFIEFSRGQGWTGALLTALTFGMAAIPEEFPLVFTLYLSLGAYRLSKKGVLVKSLPSVETLGRVDVICTDKTGTLTEGKFKLVAVHDFNFSTNKKLFKSELLALMACEPQPTDAMETAIFEKLGHQKEALSEWSLKFDYSFDPRGKKMSHVWRSSSGEQVLAMKGAVEGVLEHCDCSAADRSEVLRIVEQWASRGQRLLGLAARTGSFSGVRSEDEKNLEMRALLAFSDPVRESAKAAIQDCQKQGIEIKMLTGDHVMTAHAIAEELGLLHTESGIFSGPELAQMESSDRKRAYLKGSIFARVSPEQKFELVQTLKSENKIVAMTGDGVNDSPALKLADIGVSMGANATDVARSTAKMILLQNDFRSLVAAIFEGRNVFKNLRRSFAYLIEFHIPVVILAFVPPLVGGFQVLLPVHIILLELIVHPISAFAFENLQSDSGKNEKQLIPPLTIFTSVLSGLLLSCGALGWLLWNLKSGPTELGRSGALSILLFGNVGFTFLEAWPSLRSAKVLTLILILLLLTLILSEVDSLANIFHLQSLSTVQWIGAFSIGVGASLPSFLIRLYKNRS